MVPKVVASFYFLLSYMSLIVICFIEVFLEVDKWIGGRGHMLRSNYWQIFSRKHFLSGIGSELWRDFGGVITIIYGHGRKIKIRHNTIKFKVVAEEFIYISVIEFSCWNLCVLFFSGIPWKIGSLILLSLYPMPLYSQV